MKRSAFVAGLALAAVLLAAGAHGESLVVHPNRAAGVAAAAHPVNNGQVKFPSFYAALKRQPGMSITRAVVDASGMRPYLSNGNVVATFFPPDDRAWREHLSTKMGISLRELLLPANKALLRELIKSLIVPGRRVYTPQWPQWPRKVWLPTMQPGNRIGLEMDDGGSRPGPDRFDVDGTDDDSELVHRSWVINVKTGKGVMQTVDDVPTWVGWNRRVICNVKKARN